MLTSIWQNYCSLQSLKELNVNNDVVRCGFLNSAKFPPPATTSGEIFVKTKVSGDVGRSENLRGSVNVVGINCLS